MRSVDRVTRTEAGAILGGTVSDVRRHIAAGRLLDGEPYEHGGLSRADVEALATEVYDWRRMSMTPSSHWSTGQDSADRTRLGQLADAGRLPYVRHRDGTSL